MISKLKSNLNKLNLGIQFSALAYLSLACTDIKVVEKPGETVYIEVPAETQSETETVYVYVDQGTQEVHDKVDMLLSQDQGVNEDQGLNPDSEDQNMAMSDQEVNQDQDIPMADQGVNQDQEENPDMEMIPEQDQNMPMADQEVNPDMEVIPDEEPIGEIFEPSEDSSDLEARHCDAQIDNSRLQDNQIIRSNEINYYPSENDFFANPFGEPENEPEVYSFLRQYWNVSPFDFNEFQDIACFEYRNTGEERIVLARLTYRFSNPHSDIDYKFNIIGTQIPEIQTSEYRREITIAPVENIPIEAGQNIQVKIQARVPENIQGLDFIKVEANDPFLDFVNSYIFNYIEALSIRTWSHNITESFYLDNSNEPRLIIEGEDIDGVVNRVELFYGSFDTLDNSYLGLPLNSYLTCDSSGEGDYEVQIKTYNYGRDEEERVFTPFQLQPGENRIPIEIPPMEVNQFSNLSLSVTGNNVVQAPENGDTVECYLKRDDFPVDLDVRRFLDPWLVENIYGNHLTWQDLNSSAGEAFKITFQGGTERSNDAIQLIENNPNIEDYLVNIQLQGAGLIRNFAFNLDLSFHEGILATAKVLNSNGDELFTEDIVIPRGQSQHSLDLNIDNFQRDNLVFKIIPRDEDQLSIPTSFEQIPAQLKFDIQNLEIVNEEEEPVAVDSNLWSTYRPIPFGENAVRYFFNTPDMYLTSNFSRDEIIDIHPDGTIDGRETIHLGDFSFRNNSMARKCYTVVVFGKRPKDIEAFTQIWIRDIIVPDRNIEINYFFIDLSNEENCTLDSWGSYNEFLRPNSWFNLNVQFAGELNPETIQETDTIQVSLLYVEGYFTRDTDEGELRIPFRTFFRDQNQGWSPLNFNIFNEDGSINSDLVNQNLEAAPKGNRVTFIRHQ